MQSNGEAVNKVSIAIWIVKFLRVGYKIIRVFLKQVQGYKYIFVRFLVQMKTLKFAFEIY